MGVVDVTICCVAATIQDHLGGDQEGRHGDGVMAAALPVRAPPCLYASSVLVVDVRRPVRLYGRLARSRIDTASSIIERGFKLISMTGAVLPF